MAFEFKKYEESEEVKKAKEKASEYDTHKESQAVSDYRNKMTDYEANNNPGEWDTSQYQAVLDASNAYNNRKAFSYDLNGDALYQQYKDKYINQGRLAMADTIGQASAMTGGYGSSYAVTAGNQAYQSHLQNLNDIVPQLYQMAYDRYNQEGQDLLNKYNMASDMYENKYGEYMDKVNIYNTNLDRYIDAYNTERAYDRGVYESDRTHYTDAYNNLSSTEYARHNTEQTNAFNAYNQLLDEAQIAASIGDTSKLEELGYDTSNMSTGGGVDPLSAKEWAEVSSTAAQIYSDRGKTGLISYLQGLVDRGYISGDESKQLLDELAPVEKKGASGSGEVFGNRYVQHTKN